MKLRILEENDNLLKLKLENAQPAEANVLRRFVLARVPTLAIDEVVIYANNSIVFDEYIAHRLGQIPITTPEDLPEEVEFQLYLDAVGPKVVYAEDLQSKASEVKPARPKIPIITLNEGEELRLEGIVRMGRAAEHAKFQCAVCSYEIEEDGMIEMFIEACGQMPPRVILKKALREIIDEIEQMIAALG